ncbi:MAG: phosphate/phosphite/phosphonate ABC transporter substrate-binding protein, partial [Gammaproteobacteria bacterium]
PDSADATNLSRLVQWLSSESDYPMQIVYADSYADLSRILKEKPDSIGWTCGAPFVEDHSQTGQQLVAVPLFKGQPTYHSVIITNKFHSNSKGLVDFKGKVFAYSDPRSNSGYLVPTIELKKIHASPQSFFRMTLNAHSHEGSILYVAQGVADVAAVDEYVLEYIFKRNPELKKKIRILESFGPFPFTPIVTGKAVSPSVLARIQQALTKMQDHHEGRLLLNELDLDGFVVKTPDFYRPIANMLRQVKPPVH